MQNANNYDELLDRATQAVLDRAPRDLPPNELILATKTMVEQAQQVSHVAVAPARQREVRRWSIAALAVAASLLAIVAPFFSSSTAFAQVVSNIRKLATAKFTIENIGPNSLIAVASVKAPDRFRLDFVAPGQPVNITNGAAGELIAFDSNSNQASVNEIPKANSDFDILQLLQKPDVNAVLSRTKNTIPGTQLYDILDGQGRIWIDVQSQLPKRMEMTPPSGMGTTPVVYRDFEWDVPLEDSLFAMPVGKVVVRSSLLASPKEEELIGAFAIRQAFSQEPYEASFLDESTDPGLRLGRLAYDHNKNRADNNQIQSAKLQGIWPIIGISQSEASDPSLLQKRIDFLCMKLDQWAYEINRTGGWLGTGVRPGEAKPLCWWKDGGRIRVLRGDLTIVDADQPPANH